MNPEDEFREVYREHLIAQVPEGVLENFLLRKITLEPDSAEEWLVCNGGKEGLIRHARDSLFVEDETQFAKWRRFQELPAPWLYRFWSFIHAYTSDEGVQAMVKKTWGWTDDVGLEIYDCIYKFVLQEYEALLEAPFLPGNAENILLVKWQVMFGAIVVFDRWSIILAGKLRPMKVSLSRNSYRLSSMDMRSQAALKRDSDVAKAREMRKVIKKQAEESLEATTEPKGGDHSDDQSMGSASDNGEDYDDGGGGMEDD